MSIRLMILEDHSVFCTGLRAVIEGRNGVEVVADVGTATAGLGTAAVLLPDVILFDIGLPDTNGIDAARELRNVAPKSAVVMLTVLDDRASVWAAIQAGALGYLSKTAPLEEIERGIEAAAAGQFLLGSGVSGHISVPDVNSEEVSIDTLTLRENQLLRLLAAGHTTAQMSEQLGISTKTVRNYLSSLYVKLSVEDRAQSALAAWSALAEHFGHRSR